MWAVYLLPKHGTCIRGKTEACRIVLLTSALVWKVYTYLQKSVPLTTQKHQDYIRLFGEYKLCNDVPEEWRGEGSQFSNRVIERIRDTLLLSFTTARNIIAHWRTESEAIPTVTTNSME
jgi:hypothetical protein